MEDQYRKEREEANNLLEQQRLVQCFSFILSKNQNRFGQNVKVQINSFYFLKSLLFHRSPLSRIMRASWKLYRNKWNDTTQTFPRKRRSWKKKVVQIKRETPVIVWRVFLKVTAFSVTHSTMDRGGEGAGRVGLP